jgi:hypothetical protein
MLYFAYGSNMCTGRLQRRVKSATFVRIAKLTRHSFRFHKRSSKDGSAKGDALETGKQSDIVWGVIFAIDEREKPKLDREEGLGFGYGEKTATVIDVGGQEYDVALYIAEQSHIDTSLRPYSWYKRFVVDGARQHSLPQEYVSSLSLMPDVEDPDPERDRQERSIKC